MAYNTWSSGDKITTAKIQAIVDALGAVNTVGFFPVAAANYIIFKSGTTYYARNTTDGTIDYSGANYHTVFNNVVTALGSGGGTIYHQQAAYTLAGQITLGNYITAVYAPRSTMTVTTASDPAITLNGTKSQFTGQGFLDITHQQGTSCFLIDDSSANVLSDVWVWGGDTASSVGVEVKASSSGNYYTTINRCRFYKCSIGLKTNRTGSSLNRMRVLFSRFDLNTVGTGYGVYLDYGTGHCFVGTAMEDSDINLYYDASSASFIGCMWDASTTYEISLGASHTGLKIIGSTLYTSATAMTGTPVVSDSFDFGGDKYGRNDGTATISNGTATTGNVAHGLALEPSVVFACGSSSDTEELWCSSKDATNIVIQVPANVGGDRTIYWQAAI